MECENHVFNNGNMHANPQTNCQDLKYKKRPQKQYQSIKPVTSLEWPSNFLMTEGGSETKHTVKVPSDAPYASKSELMCPNFKTVTAHKTKDAQSKKID